MLKTMQSRRLARQRDKTGDDDLGCDKMISGKAAPPWHLIIDTFELEWGGDGDNLPTRTPVTIQKDAIVASRRKQEEKRDMIQFNK